MEVTLVIISFRAAYSARMNMKKKRKLKYARMKGRHGQADKMQTDIDKVGLTATARDRQIACGPR